MAVITANGSKGHHSFELEVTEVAGSQSITNNTSDVTFTFKIKPRTSGYDWSNWKNKISYTVLIDGTSYTGTISSYNGTSTVTLKTGTQPIQHENDGSKTIDISFTVTDTTGQSYTCGNASGSGTLTLSVIPRASTFTLSKTLGGTSTTSFTLGDDIYVNISRASNTFTHKVYFVIGSSGNQTLSNSATTSANTTLANTLAQYIPNPSGTAVMYVETWNNGVQIGSTQSLSFSIAVPSSVVPSITSLLQNDPEELYAMFGAYVQGKSKLKVTAVASGNYSTITNCTVKLKNGSTVLNTATATLVSGKYEATFNSLATAGTLTIEVTVTDSRTRTATSTASMTVAAYSNPSISTLTPERRNNDDTVTVVFNASILNVYNSDANTKEFKLYKKKTSDTSWTLLQTYTSSYTYSNNAYTTTCDGDYAWDFKIEAKDYFTTTTKTSSVGTAFELINWGADGTSIAFGKVAAESNTFECNLQSKFYNTIYSERIKNGSIYLNRAVTIDTSSLSTSNFYPVLLKAETIAGSNGPPVLDCQVISRGRTGSDPYNQNYYHFLLLTAGWSDTPKTFMMLQCKQYDSNEITLGSIGSGTSASYYVCVWVRGGNTYNFISNASHGPTLYTSTHTDGSSSDGSTYSVGTNYDGGTNTRVNIHYYPGVSMNGMGLYTTEPITVNNNAKLSNGYFYIQNNGVLTQIGSQNSTWCHYVTDASGGHYFNKPLYISGDVYAGSSYNKRLAYTEELTQNVLCARPSSNVTISATGDKGLSVVTQVFKSGSALSLSGGGIKIGAGITKVFVSASVYFSAGTNAGDSLRIFIYKGSTLVAENYERAGTSGTYEHRVIIPTPITVAENDIIYLHYSNSTGARGTISSAGTDTYLVVTEIK
jgi:hypothetical protein